jgi:hypothetical protein
MRVIAMDAAHPAAEFVVAMFGPHRNGRVHIVSLPNIKDGKTDGSPINTRSSKQIADFVARHDRPGFGCFVCVNPIKDKATRRAEETVIQIVCAHTDIDFSKVDATPEEIERAVAGLPLPPSRVHHSGHGLHLYWFLKTAIAASPENNARHKQLLGRIADHLGGDTAACSIPQLMRLPGTTNSKNGEQHPVRVLSDRADLRYELDALEQWLAAAGSTRSSVVWCAEVPVCKNCSICLPTAPYRTAVVRCFSARSENPRKVCRAVSTAATTLINPTIIFAHSKMCSLFRLAKTDVPTNVEKIIAGSPS